MIFILIISQNQVYPAIADIFEISEEDRDELKEAKLEIVNTLIMYLGFNNPGDDEDSEESEESEVTEFFDDLRQLENDV